MRNGIPLPQVGRARAPASQGTLRLLLLCRLTVEKGVRVVLDAMRRLPPSLDVELVIAGRGPLEDTARQAAAEDSRIRFLGFVQGEQKHALLTEADYLLIPSLWYENAPVAVVEAAAYGLGLIGSRIGGIPELVEHGTTGFLFTPGDAAGLAGIVEGLAFGPPDAAGISPRRPVRLPSGIRCARMVDAYEQHYAGLAERGGRGYAGSDLVSEHRAGRQVSRSLVDGGLAPRGACAERLWPPSQWPLTPGLTQRGQCAIGPPCTFRR